jgi:hypothetical protein
MKRLCVAVTVVGLVITGACSASQVPAQGTPQETAQRIRDACDQVADRTPCYDGELAALAKTGDVRGALDVVEALAGLDRSVLTDGHMYVHAIGIAAYDKDRPFAETFMRCTELFHAGCYHGVIQAHFGETGAVDAESINNLCATVVDAGADRWTQFQCLHGIGHGVVIHNGHDLLAGLDGCELLRDAWDRSSCLGGAFMENVTNATHPHHAALTQTLGGQEGGGEHDEHAHHGGAAAAPFEPIKRDDPHYPCTIVQQSQKDECYGMQTAVILFLNGYDFGKAAETCDGAPDDMIAVCHQSLGRDASGHANRDTKRLIGLCELDRSAFSRHCYVGAAKAVIDWAGDPADGMAFCRDVVGEENRAACHQAVGQQVAVIVLDPTRGRAICEAAEGRDREACLWGAGLSTERPAVLDAPAR